MCICVCLCVLGSSVYKKRDLLKSDFEGKKWNNKGIEASTRGRR